MKCRKCGERIELEHGRHWVHVGSGSMFCKLLAEPMEADACELCGRTCDSELPAVCLACHNKVQAEIVVLRKKVLEICDRLLRMSDKAYSDMIDISYSKEARGREAKVKKGEFGKKELDAHKRMGELFGRHKALNEVYRDLREACGEETIVSPSAEEILDEITNEREICEEENDEPFNGKTGDVCV